MQQSLLEINAERNRRFLQRAEELAQKRIEKSIAALEKKIIRLVDKLDVTDGDRLVATKTNLVQAREMRKQLVKIYADTYGAAYETSVKGYDTVARRIRTSFKELGEAVSFTGTDKAMITELKRASMGQFAQYGAAAQERIHSALYHHVLTGEKMTELKRVVKGYLTGYKDVAGRPMVQYARQHAVDTVNNFYNQVTIKKADDIGMTYYKYVGNAMYNTRYFCARRIGHVYSKKTVQSWMHPWEGKAGPALIYRGGYNCRHDWQPVREEWIGDKTRIDSYNKVARRSRKGRKRRKR